MTEYTHQIINGVEVPLTADEIAALQARDAAIAAAPIPPAKAGAYLLSKGVDVVSTLHPALNGNYALDNTHMVEIQGLMMGIMLAGTFPNNATTYDLHDSVGEPHTFPDVTTFKNFALSILNYVSPLTQYITSNGVSGALPTSNSIALA